MFSSRVRGCLLGGAIGDALGAPVEFLSWSRIRQVYGPVGVTDLITGPDAVAAITDDTQMTLFTVDGLIRAAEPEVLYRAYRRWLDTQQQPGPVRPDGWLAAQPWLYARRAPGNACLSGLRASRMGTPEQPLNPDSKGCGAVMRSAPFGLDPRASHAAIFDLAVAAATQTHGHPSGYLAAGAFAVIIRGLVDGLRPVDAVDLARDLLANRSGHEETSAALDAARAAAKRPAGVAELEQLGGGWVAEEALAMGVYCVLAESGAEPDPRRALLLAVNHSGDSDSTGSICGNLLGAWLGQPALPPDWVVQLEGRGTILALADDLVAVHAGGDALRRTPGFAARYPNR